MSQETIKQQAKERLVEAIHLHCYECMGGFLLEDTPKEKEAILKEIKLCSSTTCHLYPMRFRGSIKQWRY